MRIINKCLFLLLLVLSACNEEYKLPEYPETSQEGAFRLHATGYSVDTPNERHTEQEVTRMSGSEICFDRLEHYIIDTEGELVTGFRSLYNAGLSEIKAEGLRDGAYELLILAVKGDSDTDGAVIHPLTNASSPWLTFQNGIESGSLEAEYYYARHPFSVSGGKITGQDVDLNRIVGKVEFSLNFSNEYVRHSISSVEVVLDEGSTSAAALNGDGTITGGRRTENFSLPKDGDEHLYFPVAGGSTLSGKINVKSQRHTGELIEHSFDFKVAVRPNRHSLVTINVTHPDDHTGMLYIRKDAYTEDNFYTILSDSESKDVYYNSGLRSFYVNAPLQVSVVENRLQLRFYSPVSISDVTLYARLPSVKEYVEFAFIDSIPAFCNATFDLPSWTKGAVYRTESGRYVNLPAQEWDDLPDLQFKISSDDPYWQKISKLRAKWYITFNSYGGNPDTDDGRPHGNWMGMRPVHAREAVALLTNVAYMCTLDTYAAKLQEIQGTVPGNDGKTQVDMSTVIPRLESLVRLNTGLIYTGNGVLGLGGGYTLGVYQGTYLEHYNSPYAAHVVFHEMAHCMGYSHNSGMTYGNFAGTSGSFYVANIGKLPVPVKTILNSNVNPNKY